MCAVACMTLTANNYRLTFTLAAVPSIFAISMLMYYAEEAEPAADEALRHA